MEKERILSREELLILDIDTYNKALTLSANKEGHTGDLPTCKYCKRLYSICCICDEAEKRWENMITEVREVSEARNFSSRDADLFGEDRLNDALVIGRLTRERDEAVNCLEELIRIYMLEVDEDGEPKENMKR